MNIGNIVAAALGAAVGTVAGTLLGVIVGVLCGGEITVDDDDQGEGAGR